MLKNSTNTEADLWNTHWQNGTVLNYHLISDPTKVVPGFEYSRAAWTAFNHIRSVQGRWNYLMPQGGNGELASLEL